MTPRPLAVLAAALTLAACSSSTQPDTNAAPSTSPAALTAVTQPEPEPVTEIRAETPQVCIDALDSAEAVIDLAIRGLDLSAAALSSAGDLMEAIALLDQNGVDTAAAEIEASRSATADLTPQAVTARAQYDADAAACRASAA